MNGQSERILFDLRIEALDNGWADVWMMLGGQDRVLSFENSPNDALFDILHSALGLLYGMEAGIAFRNGGKRETLLVYRLTEGLCHVEAAWAEGQLPVRAYAMAVLRMFDRYFYAFSRQGYEIHWGSFPERELGLLRKQIHDC